MNSEQRSRGNIVYKFATPYDPKAKTLYVNTIPNYECSNSCRFCSRQDAIDGLPNIYEKKAGTSLYLPEAPSVKEIIGDINKNLDKKIFRGTKEIAFVGLGESLLNFSSIESAIWQLRNSGYKKKIRLDTNGPVCSYETIIPFGCFEKHVEKVEPAKRLKKAGLDEVRISVNAVNEDDYNNLCRPEDKDQFYTVLQFVKECKEANLGTFVSFVVGFDNGKVKTRPEQEYKDWAKQQFGLKKKKVLIRDYVQPLIRR